MNKTLRILHLEDLPSDAEMIDRQLKKANFPFTKVLVSSKESFINALQEFQPDIILSDHSLPSFDSQEALDIVKKSGITVPFILVTATVSEEYAVNIMKEGAWDYILKDRLQRLPNAILSAMDRFKMIDEQKKTQDEIEASEKKYKLLFESNPMPMWILSVDTHNIIAVNEAAVKHYGYTREEFMQINAAKLRPEEDENDFINYNRDVKVPLHKAGVWRHKKKDGTIIMVDIIAHDILYENECARLILANDVTDRLRAETELARQRINQQKLITETSIQAQEREREEIGTELHDNINQILSAVKLYLAYAIENNDSMLPDILQKSYENISLAISEIRQLSHRLIPPSLGNMTLPHAILLLAENIHLASTLKLEVNAREYDEDHVEKDVKLMLYRVVQEQVNNILKHAAAKKAIVTIISTPEKNTLTIQDDGKGFDPSLTAAGVGLRNITHRASLYGGETKIISSPGNGCTLQITVPVTQQKKTASEIPADIM
jgi:two-component system sensor histidine kinase UhpB